MAFNGSGVWITPTGQPVVTGTVIQSSTFNALVSDIASTFNNVVTRDGQGPMTAPFKLQSGTVTIPGLSFNAESSTGLYWPSTGVVATTVSGIEIMRLKANGAVLIDTTTDDGVNKLQVAGGILSTTANHTGAVTIGGTLSVTGLSTLASLSVTGASTLTGAVTSNTFSSSGATITGGSINSTPIGATTPGTGKFTTLQATGLFTASANAVVTGQVTSSGQAEGFRVANDSGFVAGFNSLNTLRSGYLQFTAGGAVTLSNDQAQSLVLATNSTARLTIDASGNVGMGIAPAATVKLYLSDGTISSVIGYNYSSNTISGFGTNTAHALGFLTSGAERMRIDTSGNIGIGMTPTTKVDIAAAGGMFRIGGGSGNNLIQAYSSGGTLGLWAGGSSQIYSNGTLSFLTGATTGTASPTGGVTAMTIDATGNVGIGRTASGYMLDVAGPLRLAPTNTSGPQVGIDLYDAGGGAGEGLYIRWESASRVDMADISAVGNGATGGDLVFATNPANTGSSTERMRIDANGAVAVGTNNPNNRAVIVGGRTNVDLVLKSTSASGVAGGNTLYFGNSASDGTGYINYDTANNFMSFAVSSGVERMRVDNNGDLLVGTTAASAWSTAGRGLIELNGSSTALYGMKIGGTQAGYLYHDGSTVTVMNSLAGALNLSTNGTTRVSISSTGAITMNNTLAVAGAVNAPNFVASNAEGYRTANDTAYVSFYNTANATRSGYIQGNASAGGMVIASEAAGAIGFNTGGSSRMSITAAGVIQDAAGNELGYKGLPQNSPAGAYTLVVGDKGKHVYMGSVNNVTVPASTFSAGDVITVLNGNAGTISLVQGTSVTLYQAGTANTGNRTIAVHGICSILCVASNTFFVSGNIS